MPDAGARRGQRVGDERLTQVPELAGALLRGHVVAVDQGDAGGVVAAVLEPGEALHDHVESLAVDVRADVAHDAAHGGEPNRGRRGTVLGPGYATMSAVTQDTSADWLGQQVGHQVLERGDVLSPYIELDRETWSRLRQNHPMSLTADDVTRLRGLGDPLDMKEIEDVYLPISRLLNYYVGAISSLHDVTSEFLGEQPPRTPFVIGVAGSVAVGKSTTSRILRELLSHWPDTPRVQLVTTDGFLFPNAELERRNIMARKGFPESYDRRALMRFVAADQVRRPRGHGAGLLAPDLRHRPATTASSSGAPTCSSSRDSTCCSRRAPASTAASGVAVNDYFDFTVYVDAEAEDVERWYVERFLRLRETAFADPDSYFHRYAVLTDEQAEATAARIWREINGPNLVENILPTRSRATLVLVKGPDHSVEKVRLRKL